MDKINVTVTGRIPPKIIDIYFVNHLSHEAVRSYCARFWRFGTVVRRNGVKKEVMTLWAFAFSVLFLFHSHGYGAQVFSGLDRTTSPCSDADFCRPVSRSQPIGLLAPCSLIMGLAPMVELV